MIPENTTQNKAAFMALYWGQEVYEWEYPRCATKPGIIESEPNLKTYSGCVFLNLKPLSQISDEDAIEYLGLHVWDYINNPNHGSFGMSPSGYFLDCYLDSTEIFSNYGLDYLRSKGYAISWMGLSVDDLIEYGWVKLKEEVEK